MISDISEKNSIKPLTRICKETRQTYSRRNDVIAEIEEILNLSEDNLTKKLVSLKSETLVFLLREKFQNDRRISQAIWVILSKRLSKIIKRQRPKFKSETDFEDFFSEIQVEIFERIADFESDRADFAQVSFSEFATGIMLNKKRQKENLWKQESRKIEIDAESESDKKLSLIAELTDAEKILLLREALDKLPPEIMEVCVLYYLEGWAIHSKNPRQVTIAGAYGKSEKTIRNWLRQAEKNLADYREVLK
jgi:RNA polymerase sigma factor (sigma-70 family)